MTANNLIGIKWLKALYGLLIFRSATAPLLILSAWGNLKYMNSLSMTDTKDLQTVTELFTVLTIIRALVQLPAVIMKNSEKGYSLLIASLITEIAYYCLLVLLGGGTAIADDVRLLITVAYAIPSFFYIHKRKFLYSDDGEKHIRLFASGAVTSPTQTPPNADNQPIPPSVEASDAMSAQQTYAQPAPPPAPAQDNSAMDNFAVILSVFATRKRLQSSMPA